MEIGQVFLNLELFLLKTSNLLGSRSVTLFLLSGWARLETKNYTQSVLLENVNSFLSKVTNILVFSKVTTMGT